MNHNQAADLFGRCACPCHTGSPGCWCANVAVPDPYAISHNDRVRYLGGCHCRLQPCAGVRTDPVVAAALRDRDDNERDRRLRTGRPRASDLSYAARRPHRYPHLFG